MTTLASLVTMVREESGHAISAAQGVNALESIKYLINRTQYELWVAFQWPTLVLRGAINVPIGQYYFPYPSEIGFDQIREMYWTPDGSTALHRLDFGINEEFLSATGGNNEKGNTIRLWDVKDEDNFRIWPTPSSTGSLRLKGMKKLSPLIDDTDSVTLDPTLIALMVSAELLSRAKSGDAEIKSQKAQRHLKELLGNKISAKNKVTTFGATRGLHGTPSAYPRFMVR